MTFRSYKAALCAALVVSAVAARAAELPADTAVARVGTRSITRGEFTAFLLKYYGRKALRDLEQRSQLRQEAARYKLELSDKDVKDRIAQLTGGNPIKDQLERQGIPESEWREQVRYAVLAEKVTDRKWPVKDDDLTRLSVRYARMLTQQQARELIKEAKNGIDFRNLAMQRGLDHENDAYVSPNPFFRIDAPQFFRMTTEANLRPGQVTRDPIPSDRYFLVLKLEKVYPPETLKAGERDQAIRRIRAYRQGGLMDLLNRRYKPVETLPTETPDSPTAAVAKVGAETIDWKQFAPFLYEVFGKTGLERLTERSIVAQKAEEAGVRVSEAEASARLEQVRKPIGKEPFQSALDKEGITEAAWKERVRYSLMAEKVTAKENPVTEKDLERLLVKYIRVATRPEAVAVIQELQNGAKFETVMMQKSLDKGDGYVRPKPFMRIENEIVFKVLDENQVAPGSVLGLPVEIAQSFAVFKLEDRIPAAKMKPEERDAATRRIIGLRMGELLEAWRKQYKVENLVPMSRLAAAAKS